MTLTDYLMILGVEARYVDLRHDFVSVMRQNAKQLILTMLACELKYERNHYRVVVFLYK